MDTPVLAWLRDITGVSSYRQIGERVGTSQTTILRWSRNGIPFDSLVRICVEAKLDLLDAMVKLRMLSADDRRKLTRSLDSVPTHWLSAELHRRVLEHEAAHRR